MDIYSWLLITHLLGTVLAIGGATMIEFHLTQALKDGSVSPDEGGMLALDYSAVRIGFVVSLLSGFGFLLMYQISGQSFRLHDPVLWAKMLIVVVVGINALLLQAHKMSFYWGAALSFVSWWTIGLLGFFLTNGVKFNFIGDYSFINSFLSVMLAFFGAVIAGAYVLHIVRSKLTIKKT